MSVSEQNTGLEVSGEKAYKFDLKNGDNTLTIQDGKKVTISFKARSTDSLFTVPAPATPVLQAYAVILSANEGETSDGINKLDASYSNGVITLSTNDLDKYYMVADTLKTMIDKTVSEANTWLDGSSFKDWFKFVAATDDNGKITVTLKIDVSQIWKENSSVPSDLAVGAESTSNQWDGFLTNLGNLFKQNFTDIGVTTIKADNYTIFNTGSFQTEAFTNFFVHSLVGVNNGVNENGIFKVLSNMTGDSNNVRTISVEVSGTEDKVSNVSFDAVINVWQPESYAPHKDGVTAINKIASFAGTISKHLSLEEQGDKLSLTITAPDKLVESALNQISNNTPNADYNTLAEKFNSMNVSNLLTKIAALEVSEVVGSQSSAVNKFLGFLNTNDVFINKVLQKTQITFDKRSNTTVDIFDHNKTFGSSSDDDSGPTTPSDWTKFVNALSNVLTDAASNETPGAYWNNSTKMYEMNAHISVDLSNFNNAAKAKTGVAGADGTSFGIDMNVTIVLNVFGDHKNDGDISKTSSTETTN